MNSNRNSRAGIILMGIGAILYLVMGIWFRVIKPMNRPITEVHRAIASGTQWLNTSRKITPEDLRGRIILLDFWTYSCINCLHVIPYLQRMEKNFGTKLTVIGVHSGKFENEKNIENIRAAVKRYGIEYPVVNDPEYRIWKKFGVNVWPTMVLIDPDGEIELSVSGEGHHKTIENEIYKLQSKFLDYSSDKLPIELESSKVPDRILSFPGKMTYVKSYLGEPALFISDTSQHRIVGARLTGEVFVSIGKKNNQGFKDGNFSEALFNSPQGLIYRRGKLYVADTGNHLLREADLNSKKVRTIAGTGKQKFERKAKNKNALKTSIASPWDLAFYPDQYTITIAMAGTHQLWEYHLKNKTLSVVAGNGREFIDDGMYPVNSLSQPSGLSVLKKSLYFVDSETSALRVLKNGRVKTLIGTGLFDFGLRDGNFRNALMQHPLGLFAHLTGIYIADTYNHVVRRYDLNSHRLETLFRTGKKYNLSEPGDILFINDQLWILDTNHHRIAIFDPKSNQLNEFALHESLIHGLNK